MGKTLKIDVYSVMFNEEVILPYFLRHYDTIADRIFVWEDESTDSTREILSRHPKVTLMPPLDVHGVDDGYWVTQVFPQYAQYSRGVADWVIFADADEFIYHPCGLAAVLAKEKLEGTQLIHCDGYTMFADAPPTTAGQIYDEIRLGVPDRWSCKWSVFSPEIEARFQRGRHGHPIVSGGAATRKHTGIRNLHYRYLGPEYFESRDICRAQRIGVAENTSRAYSPMARHNLPDGTRGIPLQWYERNKAKARDVTGVIDKKFWKGANG